MLKKYLFHLDRDYSGNNFIEGFVKDADEGFITVVRDSGSIVVISVEHIALVYELNIHNHD